MDEEQDAFTGDRDPRVLDIDADLRDDTYFNLVEDFLGSQSGERLHFDEGSCKNRLLIQVGLMREDKQVSWRSVQSWLQKIFPMYHSSNFQGLIERSIQIALSLKGHERHDFLNSDVNFEFVGPICDSLGIVRADLLKMSDFSGQAKCTEITNGLVLELSNFVTREKMDPIVLVSWLRNFNPRFCSDGRIQKANKVLQKKLKKFKIDYRKYQRSRSRRNSMMEKFLQAEFELVPKALYQVRKPHGVNEIKKSFVSKYQNSGNQMAKAFPGKNAPLHATEEQMHGNALSQGGDGSKLMKSEENEIKWVWKYPVKSEPTSINLCQSKSLLEVKTEYETSSPQARRQVTNGSVELGDSAKAEALTLLDVSMLSLQKLLTVYGEKMVSKQVTKDLIQKYFMLMLEEDSVMKDFNEKVKSFQKVPSPLHFLDCNANFLHEISNAVEQQILVIEREIILSTGEKLGRDKNPKFSNFVNFSESAASRYVRMACDVFSPRGETKHSCRRQWLTFCKAREKPSKLAVSQSNRFNSFFEGAAGLVHHHADIIQFFSDPLISSTCDWPNVIHESVADDASDQVIQALVCVIAIVYCKILGPYWQLLKSSAEYVYFHRYVHCLHQNLMQWSEDASLLLLPVYSDSNVFHQFPLQEKSFDGVFSYCRPNSENQHAVLIRKCLEKMMKIISAVTEANLKDFLPGGVHCQDPAPETCAKLRSCQLSHLMGEYPYGHAYPYKGKKSDNSAAVQMTNFVASRESSIPQRNGFTLVLNRSITGPERISHTISRGNTTFPLKKGKHLQSQNENADLKEKDKLQDCSTKDSILAAIAKNRGPCTSKQDVDHLLAKLDGASHAQKREAIRSEISYQKVILGSRDKNLNQIGFSLSDMVTKLKMVLPDDGEGSISAVGERTVGSIEEGMGHSQHLYSVANTESPERPSQQDYMAETSADTSEPSIALSSDSKSLINRGINLGKNRLDNLKSYRENFEFNFSSLHN